MPDVCVSPEQEFVYTNAGPIKTVGETTEEIQWKTDSYPAIP